MVTWQPTGASGSGGGLTEEDAIILFQAKDSDLTDVAAVVTTSWGRSMLAYADASAARSNIGCQASHANLTTLVGITFGAFVTTLLTYADAAALRAGIFTGTPDGTKYLKDDGSWGAVSVTPVFSDADLRISNAGHATNRLSFSAAALTAARICTIPDRAFTLDTVTINASKTSGGTSTGLLYATTNTIQQTSAILTDGTYMAFGVALSSTAKLLFGGSGRAIDISTSHTAAIINITGSGSGATGVSISMSNSNSYGMFVSSTSANTTPFFGNNNQSVSGYGNGGIFYGNLSGTGNTGAVVIALNNGNSASAACAWFGRTTNVTNTHVTATVYDIQSTGTAAAGFGGINSWLLETSTTASMPAVGIRYYWLTATHASRTSAMAFWFISSGGTYAEYHVLKSGELALAGGSLITIGASSVLGPRITGWGGMSGTATRTNFDTTTVTLPELAERVKALIDDCQTHGFIGS